MTKITITEALAELQTLDKRLQKKRSFVAQYLVRQEKFKDPLEKDGGSAQAIAQTRQSIKDLETRKLALRRAIRTANENTEVTVCGTTRAIADWLAWRREIAPQAQAFLANLSNAVQRHRADATRAGYATVSTKDVATQPLDLIINLDEAALAQEIEDLEETLGNLDGQLSLKNATTFVELE